MTLSSRAQRLSLGALLFASVAAAQSDSARPSSSLLPPSSVGPPIRRIESASALSKEKLGAIISVRELPDGRVLVNDGGSRRLLLLDTMLVLDHVVLDSASEKENTYGVRQGAIIPHRGDSTIFIDQNSLALLLIDGKGEVARVRSVPRAQDVYLFASNSDYYGNPGVDARGRLVFRMYAEATPPKTAPPKGVPWFPEDPDSAFIVAMDLDTRKLDTIGTIHTPKSEFTVRLNPGGGYDFYNNINPIRTQDEWAVLSDGSVAIVRVIDYRIEYVRPDGSKTSSGKIPYDWQPLSDSAKQWLVDSVRVTQGRSVVNGWVTSMIRWVNTYNRKYPANFTIPADYPPPNGFMKSWHYPSEVKFPEKYIYGCAPGEEPQVATAAADDSKKAKVEGKADASGVPSAAAKVEMIGPGMGIMLPGAPNFPPGSTPSCIPQPIPNLAQVPQPPRMREVTVVNARLLPDFRPPFPANSVRADMDGGLWIRANQTRPVQGVAVFDVVNREGQLTDRIQLPQGYTLVGFGRGKVVFLAMRDKDGPHLARVRLR